MPVDLAVVVPTRGRPDNVRKVISAWDFTNAWDVADLVLAVDADDPEYPAYVALYDDHPHPDTGEPLFLVHVQEKWLPMVAKLNLVSKTLAEDYFAVGFAGDDHLPQTIGWAQRYLTVLRELGTGMVYGDDGYQGANLSTEWAVTADVVRELGRMVPAPVEHMYCDNAMMDLFGGAGALRHLPEVRIEHFHPVAGKAASDVQYERVNGREQYARDRRAYEGWKRGAMAADVARIRALRPGRPEVQPVARVRRSITGSGPRPVDLRSTRRGSKMGRNTPFPRHFKDVRGATPAAIEITLADFAKMVPAGQEIVELGVFQGRTALAMAWGARQGSGAHVTAVDAWDLPGNTYGPPFNENGSKRWAAYWVQSFGYSRDIRLVQGFAAEVAESYDGPPVGLLFVDDDHSRDGAHRAITAWAPHLADGALIAVDDYGHPDWPGVREAVDALVEQGVLEPVELFHDRLAVTRLAEGGRDITPEPELARTPAPTAITSEGITPSPYPVVEDQVAVGPAAGEVPLLPVDTSQSTAEPGLRVVVSAGELDGVPEGTMIDQLNLVNLKALAKRRGIVLGIRKDKRELILQALQDGR